MELTDLNGTPLSAVKLTLDFEPASGKLAIDGDLSNLDIALNILAQATRWLEARYMMHQQMILIAEQQRDQAILSGMRQ